VLVEAGGFVKEPARLVAQRSQTDLPRIGLVSMAVGGDRPGRGHDARLEARLGSAKGDRVRTGR
jgi:hypothetical protein